MNDVLYNSIGWTMIHSLWQISLVILLVYIVIHSGLLKSSKAKFLFAAFGMVMIGTMASLTFLYYLHNNNDAIHIISSLESPIKFVNSNPVAQVSILTWLDQNMLYLSLAWISGFIVYVLKLIGGIGYLGFIKTSSIPLDDPVLHKVLYGLIEKTGKYKKISLLISDKVLSPMTFGLYRVSIVLPLSYFNQMSLRDTEIILAHEIAHILRYDYLINLLINFVKTFFYFHPGIWWLNRVIEVEREKATDLLACQIAQSDTIEYAKTLLKAQEMRQQIQQEVQTKKTNNVLVIPFYKSNKLLLSRIEHILGKNRDKSDWIHRLTSIGLFLGIFTLLSFTQIILPRSGKMVHPVMEGESLMEVYNNPARDKNIVTKSDSSTVNVIIELETKNPGEKEKYVSTQSTQDILVPLRPEENIEIVVDHNLEIENEALSNPRQFIIHHTLDEHYDSLHIEKLILEGEIRSKEQIVLKIEQEEKMVDSIKYMLNFNDHIDLDILARIEPNRLKLNEYFEQFKKRTSEHDSLIKHKYYTFKNSENDFFSWNEHFSANMFPRTDSIQYHFHLDQNMIENLKMEGLEHIEEFRYKHYPVDESRIVKILYIES